MAGPTDWQIYDQFLNKLGKKSIDLSDNTHAFKVALFQSSSNCGSKSHSTAFFGDFTNECSGNGYPSGGIGTALQTAWNYNGSGFGGDPFYILNFQFDPDSIFEADGGDIVCRFAVIYDDDHPNKLAVCYSILDSAPADITVPDGDTLTIPILDVFFAGRPT